MKIIGIGIQKGGSGKTTMSIALASELAKSHKVVLIDGDPQGNASIATLTTSIEKELVDVILGKEKIEDCVYQSDLLENLFILPTKPNSENLRNYKQGNGINEDRFVIEDTVKSLEKYGFEYCIIDTSPDFSTFEKYLFLTCEEILPVISCDYFANEGFGAFVSNIQDYFRKQRKEAKISNIIINKVNESMGMDNVLLAVIQKNTNFKYFQVPQDQSFRQTQLMRKIIPGKPKTKIALEEIAKEIK